MNFSISDVPQADELRKVILTTEAVSNNFQSDSEIADYVGFTVRQGRYYRLAAEILGLLTNKSNEATITELGNSLVVLDEANRARKIRSILLNNSFFKELLKFVQKNPNGVSRMDILQYLSKTVNGAESTIERRLFTVISWLKDTDLIIVDFIDLTDGNKENLYFFNSEIVDSEDDENFNNGSIYPADYNNEELEIKEDHLQVIALQRKQEQGKILIPEFQRNQVWKQQQKSRFIESLILNIPVPPFYVSQDLNGNSIIIDGLQRTTSILEFLKGDYKLVGLEALPLLNDKYFSQLDEPLRARIEDRNLLLYTLKPSVPLSIVYDIFNRINSNGTVLNRQEIRNCIFIGSSTKLIKKLSLSNEFKLAINNGISSTRMKDREAILRILAFTIFKFESDYKGDMDEFLSRVMRRLNVLQKDELVILEDRFIRVMKLTYSFFGTNNFRLGNNATQGRINIAIMETICYFFNLNNDQYLETHKQNIILNYEALLEDPEYLDAVRSSTNSEKKVKKRFNKAVEILSKI